MKKSILRPAAALLALMLLLGGCGEKHRTENYGLANMTLHVSADGIAAPFDAAEVVPAYDALIEALRSHGYAIVCSETAPDGLTAAQRVLACKGDAFVDICYGLDETAAQAAFDDYAALYGDYYIIAQNQRFVYCVSSKVAFRDAGFAGLANDGVQFICE